MLSRKTILALVDALNFQTQGKRGPGKKGSEPFSELQGQFTYVP